MIMQSNAATQMGAQVKAAQPERRRELDVMGALVVVGLAFFHTLQIFSGMGTYVMNEPSSMVALFIVAFAALWGMRLMFLIAGMAIWYSLRRQTAGEFLVERVRRLVVPFVTGMLIIVPIMAYYRLKGDPTSLESYAQFYPRFFNVSFALSAFPRFLIGAPPDGPFETGHLYFLNYLFVYTLILLPLFLYLRKPAGRGLVERFASSAHVRGPSSCCRSPLRRSRRHISSKARVAGVATRTSPSSSTVSCSQPIGDWDKHSSGNGSAPSYWASWHSWSTWVRRARFTRRAQSTLSPAVIWRVC